MEQLFTDAIFDKIDYKDNLLPAGEYENCQFTNCDFANSNLSSIKFIECRFTECNLSMVKTVKTVFNDCQFNNCKMLGIRFDQCSEFALSFQFDNCTLNHSSFYTSKIRNTVFKNSALQEVDFTETDLTSAVIDNCNLADATFENTILEKADLRRSYNYSIDPEKNRVKKAKFSLSAVAGLLGKYQLDIDAKS